MTTDVLIFIHGVRTQNEPESPNKKYKKFRVELTKLGIDDTYKPIYVEYAHELPSGPVADRTDHLLHKAQKRIDKLTRWENVKKLDDANNHKGPYDPGTLGSRLLANAIRDFWLRGFGDIFYYLGDGKLQIQDAVFGQICRELLPYLGNDVRLHFLCQSWGNIIAYDFLEQLKGQATYVSPTDNDTTANALERCREAETKGTLKFASWSSCALPLPPVLLRRSENVIKLAQDESIDTENIGIRQTEGPIQWKIFYELDDPLGFAARAIFNDPGKAISQYQVSFADRPLKAHVDYWDDDVVRKETASLINETSE
ncbi:MAG: hypothetical protein ACKVH8_11340 [Pirellulales bacterium]